MIYLVNTALKLNFPFLSQGSWPTFSIDSAWHLLLDDSLCPQSLDKGLASVQAKHNVASISNFISLSVQE